MPRTQHNVDTSDATQVHKWRHTRNNKQHTEQATNATALVWSQHVYRWCFNTLLTDNTMFTSFIYVIQYPVTIFSTFSYLSKFLMFVGRHSLWCHCYDVIKRVLAYSRKLAIKACTSVCVLLSCLSVNFLLKWLRLWAILWLVHCV